MSSLKAPQKGSAGGGQRPELDEGTYPGRLVQVIDLGLQPQRPYKGRPKPPKNSIYTTYELADEFMLDENGEEDEDRPLWISEEFPLNPLESDRATSTKRYTALDPELIHEGDWSMVVKEPVNITVVINKSGDRVYQNIASTSPMRSKDKARMPELKNDVKIFALSDPDLEVFLSLPEWLQDKIKGNLEYKGSKLEKMLKSGGAVEEEDYEEEEEEVKPRKARKAVKVEEEDDEDW